MSIDREEAWQEAWRDAAEQLGIDPDTDDGESLDLIWDEAAKLMTEWGIPLPEPATQDDVEV
ncbi:hypothetical protein WK39_27325 [Burkholderia cepacia]|uniref:hypothetical protein n=1 Tax=Burkholderia cepacia TaxID=292 RepID=UPI00075D77BE|nr:hypothetical protein [Burkholderia cepacia]KVS51659.1 hypothetical protein WK39_27325 [Burkholderia cepacia]KVS69903.1 hypothetical protein WK40_04710 [Burkholderia cepacia]